MLRIVLFGVGLTLSQPVAPGAAETMFYDYVREHTTTTTAAESFGMGENRHLSRVITLKYE
ncbi:MAG: hypothetical protein LC637_07970 [Xanthomonadaceae bacterium]|nr:hypothetical protein [Xanthomonadaceae bacterium]